MAVRKQSIRGPLLFIRSETLRDVERASEVRATIAVIEVWEGLTPELLQAMVSAASQAVAPANTGGVA